MIQGRDFVVFADDWHGLPTSANHIFRRIARNNRVFWFNTVGRLPSFNRSDAKKVYNTVSRWFSPKSPVADQPNFPFGLVVNTAIMVPWFRPIVRTFNRWSLLGQYQRIRDEYQIQHPVVVTTFPYTVDILRSIPDAQRLYYCVDDFLDYPGVAKQDWAVMEAEMLELVDGLVVTSQKLAEKQTRNCPLLHLPHGVDYQHFQNSIDPPVRIPIMEAISGPVVGFFGLISSWVDVDLMCWLAERFPQVSFVMIGRVENGIVIPRQLPNLHWLGLVPYADLPQYARYFDIGLIPFVLNQLTRAVNPLKLLEYFALGLPVVSTRLPELIDMAGPILLAETREEFACQILAFLESPPDPASARSQAKINTWDQRVEQLGDFIEQIDTDSIAGLPQSSAQDSR